MNLFCLRSIWKFLFFSLVVASLLSGCTRCSNNKTQENIEATEEEYSDVSEKSEESIGIDQKLDSKLEKQKNNIEYRSNSHMPPSSQSTGPSDSYDDSEYSAQEESPAENENWPVQSKDARLPPEENEGSYPEQNYDEDDVDNE